MNKRIVLTVFTLTAFTGLISGIGYTRYFSSYVEEKVQHHTSLMLQQSGVSKESSEARNILLKYARKMSGLEMPSKKKKYFMHYTVITESVQEDGKENLSSATEIQVYMSSKVLSYESNLVSYYKDTSDVYTVIHPQKLIMKAKAMKGSNQKVKTNVLIPLQDSLFLNAKILSYGDTRYNGTAVKRIELKPDEVMSQKMGVDRIIYYYNSKESRMMAQEILYNKRSKVIKTTYLFHTMDLKYKGNIKSTAKENFFDRTKLKDRWKGYHLEDNQ